ncbi:MAG: imidazole glycerol phosphate synthase subunit HisH [Candidatus Abyssubacteria bacterium]
MIAIVDYQMGNLRSVQKAFERSGFKAVVTDDASRMMDADGVVLPGVGAFGDCCRELRSRHLVEPLLEWIESGRPFLGICLGLQVLLGTSEESRNAIGLNVIPGRVMRFTDSALKVPHMGWNRVSYLSNGRGDCPLFENIPENTYFYFVHSYYAVPEDMTVAAGLTEYGVTFVSAVWRDNVFATQFHPEKSQAAGLKLIENFGKVVERARGKSSGRVGRS